MRTRYIAWMMLLLAAPPTAALSQTGPAGIDRANTTPDKLGRQTRRDLDTILGPDATYDNSTRDSEGEAALVTRPVATLTRGLCQRDKLLVAYVDRLGVDPKVKYKPLRARGLSVIRQYRVIGDLESRKLGLEVTDASPYDAECADAGMTDTGWFTAADEHVAVMGSLMMWFAEQALLNESKKLSGCEDAAAADRARCEAHLLEGFRDVANRDHVKWIEMCNDDKDKSCFAIASEDWVVTVVQTNVGVVERIEVDAINHVI